jgi:PKHD-type hydroxylase
MYLINEWYFFTSAIDKKTCNKIKALGKDTFRSAEVDRQRKIEEEDRKTGIEQKYTVDKEKRISDVSWTVDQWVIDLLWPYMMEANKSAGWGFDIQAVEDMQITRYKAGMFYDWHRDGRADCLSTYDNPDNKFLHGYGRKLSMTILLNDNYEGGDFQFCTYGEEKNKVHTPEFNSTGSIIVFPSFMEHRVLPVTKGTRYSLVAWFIGPPFK